MSKIAVDVMGGDHGPEETIKGCVEASKQVKSELILIGEAAIIEKELKKHTYSNKQIKILDAKEVITMEDSPVQAIRTKKDSSMVKGLNLVKGKKADAFVSAGNTGALLTGATLIVGRIKGVARPGLGSLIPTDRGFKLLIDCGANADAKASYLMQFAHMGNIYIQELMNIEKPTIGLINIGVEKGKGNTMVKEAYDLLEESDLNFIGNIEARDIPQGKADILVCDGFVGNIVLKYMEGFGSWMFQLLQEELTKTWFRKLGASMLIPALKTLKGRFDYSEHGGAPLLGLNGLVIKTHGSAKAKQIKYTIIQADQLASQNIAEKIAKQLSI